ncbi:response regulator [Blastopirellula sp. JC732]|uniref:Response regulator n=1 Tax=Blastopirellula sediminis TaxID=2894196 RepID=A0A9X1MQ21_9BACT|nr:response regulator [Blastopirellula sediminis]MCC9606427.1 response regulator [Blastopirellula sediminis]MCC9630275.1 response regulator [Blastopirellula sediminis]
MKQAKRTIVHVDDSKVILEMVHDLLTEIGFDACSVDDPCRVPEALEATGSRILISDIEMPQMNGLDLLKRTKGEDGGISVIMLTGAVGPSAVLQSMRWGAEACHFKPLNNTSRLIESIQAAYAKQNGWWTSLNESHKPTRLV